MLLRTKRAIRGLVGLRWYLFLSGLRQVHRNYEPHFHEFLKLIPRGGTLLDVGANVGITSAIAKRKRPDLTLVAFEPVPDNLVVLRRMQKFYAIRQMRIEPVAVGDTNRTVAFVVPNGGGLPATMLSHVASPEYHNRDVEGLPSETIEVQMRTLDSFELPRVDAIKMDVEDHEYYALQGAKHLLRTFRPLLLCELWETENRPRTIALMESLGYNCSQLGEIDFLFTPAASPVSPEGHGQAAAGAAERA